VFGIMEDKDFEAVMAPMRDIVDHWCVTALPSPRSAQPEQLAEKLAALKPAGAKEGDFSVTAFATPAEAYADAVSRAGENDRIVVFGSFYTVAGVMAARKSSLH
jgi:dihydrofolate synthase/folylpolyglutamate synthase